MHNKCAPSLTPEFAFFYSKKKVRGALGFELVMIKY